MPIEQPPPGGEKPEVLNPAPASDQNAEVIQKLSATVDKLSAEVTSLHAKLRVAGKPTTPEKTTEPEQEGSAIAEVRKLKEERRIEREQAAELSKRTTIKAAIAAHGVTGRAAKDLEARVHYEYGKSLKVVNGEVKMEDPDTAQEFTIEDFIKDKILTGADADQYKPAPLGGTKGSAGLRPGQRSAGKDWREMSAEERAKLPDKEKSQILRDIAQRFETGQ